LDFDGKNFLKDKEKVTHFIATEKIKDSDKKEYTVEYTIEKQGSNNYRITSSPYFADID